YDYIIFNNGAEGDQTDNLDFVINGVFNNKRMEWDVVPDDPSENPSEDPIEPSEKPSEDPNPSEGEEEKLMGDINGDGKITVFDATLLQRFIAKMDELTEEQLSICDMDNDGQIKVFDATILQRIVAKQD
ncbi:MAG: dockerin type I repeat-containing protein, partial [Ruminococcus sp.]|nr:dockerin type I repeat-containing protein [Ruminococcus sp.]